MKNEDTICYNVTRSIEDLEKAIKTGNLDALGLVRRLHRIREQAQKMENGLKHRKEIMVREGFEDEYQALKKKLSVPGGTNKIYNEGEERTKEKIEFEFTIKRDGEIVYQNKAYAGVLCIVEKVEDIDEMGNIIGTTQKFTCGNPMMTWFAFDQLKIAIEARGLEIMQSIKQAIEDKKFVDPSVKKQIIEATNKMEDIK
jgi:hypothetical protein